MKTLVKGSEEYKNAQGIANNLVRMAHAQRWNNNSIFEIYYNKVGLFVTKMKNVSGFAAEVANTIDSKMSCFGYQVAYISDKQAWILACSAVENGINL